MAATHRLSSEQKFQFRWVDPMHGSARFALVEDRVEFGQPESKFPGGGALWRQPPVFDPSANRGNGNAKMFARGGGVHPRLNLEAGVCGGLLCFHGCGFGGQSRMEDRKPCR